MGKTPLLALLLFAVPFLVATCAKTSAIVAGAPTITSLSPTFGSTSGGTSLTITGTGFRSGLSVALGGTASPNVSVVSSSSVTAVSPALSAGTVDLVVTNPDGQSATSTGAFIYGSGAPPAPTLTSVTANSGSTAGGVSVTLAGTAFQSGATVTFGGSACTSVLVNSASQLQCTTPAHSAGAVDVVVTNPDAQSATLTGGYTYTAVTVFAVVNSGAAAYSINGAANPTLTLTRGTTYTFNVNASGHPFYIKSVQGTGTGNAYNTGVTNNGVDSGTITFAVPLAAPNPLFYNCEFHGPMTGTIQVN